MKRENLGYLLAGTIIGGLVLSVTKIKEPKASADGSLHLTNPNKVVYKKCNKRNNTMLAYLDYGLTTESQITLKCNQSVVNYGPCGIIKRWVQVSTSGYSGVTTQWFKCYNPY